MRLLVLLIYSLIILPPLSELSQGSKYSITGKVLDESDAAIVNVRVEAYRQGGRIDEDLSAPDGGYSLSFDGGGPIDTIRYDHSDWFPGTVEDISGTNNHRVVKTLYKRSSARLHYLELQEIVFSFERVAALDGQNETIVENGDKYQYIKALRVIDELINSIELSAENRDALLLRIATIRSRYGG